MSTTVLPSLDAMRAIAALVVVIGHVRGLYFVDWARVSSPTIAARGAYFLTGLGGQAVMVFFVLSGYLVGGSVLAAHRRGSWSWRPYLARRISRLGVVLLPALLLGLFWDRLGSGLFAGTGIYEAPASYRHLLALPLSETGSIGVMLGNALFLQTIVVPPFGTNGPLWSLAYEWWYYLAFPLLVLAVKSPSWARRVCCGLASAAVMAFVGPIIALYFLVWLLGVAVAIAPRPVGTRGRLVAAALLLAGSLVASKTMALPRFAADGLVATAFALVLLATVSHESRLRGGEWWARLAAFSYTLYAVHFPLVLFLHAWYVDRGGVRWQPAPARLAAAIGLTVVVVAYAWLVSRFTEAQTDRVRRTILRVIEPGARR